jgi:hypothetical protein
MNELNPIQPPMIPPAAPPSLPSGEAPLGSNSMEQAPIKGVFAAAEALVRQPRRVLYQLRQSRAGTLIWGLLAVTVVSSLVYGLVLGTFSGGEQYWGSPLKVAGGLLISALICLPSLYIFSCLGGSQARLVEVFGLVAGLLALTTILLIGFAPVAWVFSQSTKSLAMMGGLHIAFWVVATIFGVRFLGAGFRHFNGTSDAGLKVWVVIFLLVCLQMTTALRPIIGKSDRFLPAAEDKKFFAAHWMDCINADTADAAPPKKAD